MTTCSLLRSIPDVSDTEDGALLSDDYRGKAQRHERKLSIDTILFVTKLTCRQIGLNASFHGGNTTIICPKYKYLSYINI
jgi:hypothetical protein